MCPHCFLSRVLLILIFISASACSPPPQALKPVASQNQKNIVELSTNVRALIALYEPLLNAVGDTIIYQHIGKTRQELHAVANANVFAIPGKKQQDSWESLLKQLPPTIDEKFLERYHLIKSALARGVSEKDLNRLKYQEGWIFTIATDTQFTPQKARKLLEKLDKLQDTHSYYTEAETLLTPYDPVLDLRRQAVNNAKQLLAGLKKQVNQQLATAGIHAQSVANFVGAEVDVEKTLKTAVSEVDLKELESILNQLSQKYLDNPSYQDAAIELLIKGAKKLLSSR